MARWTFEPGHTAAEFKVRHMMVTWVRGHFADIHGTPDRISRQLEVYPPVRLPSSRISSASLWTRPARPPNRPETFAE